MRQTQYVPDEEIVESCKLRGKQPKEERQGEERKGRMKRAEESLGRALQAMNGDWGVKGYDDTKTAKAISTCIYYLINYTSFSLLVH